MREERIARSTLGIQDGEREVPVEGNIQLLLRHRALVTVSAVASGAAFFLLSFLLPASYEAVTTLIPAPSRDAAGVLSRLGSSLADLGIQTGGSADYSPMYSEIVRSRRVIGDLLSQRFSTGNGDETAVLIDVVQPKGTGRKRNDQAYLRMRDRVDVGLNNRTGVLTIRARAPSPVMAAEIANSLDSMLLEFTISTLASQAANNRRFIERQLAQTETQLATAENELSLFRQRNIRIEHSPRLLLEEGRLARGVREQEEIYLTLKRQWELARMEEYRDVPNLVILDRASAPTEHHSPRRLRLLALGATMGALLCAAYVIATKAQSVKQ